MNLDKQYGLLLEDILAKGTRVTARTQADRVRKFGASIGFDMSNGGFPLLTHKLVPRKAVLAELKGFLSGATTVKEFQEHGCHIWDLWYKRDNGYSAVPLEKRLKVKVDPLTRIDKVELIFKCLKHWCHPDEVSPDYMVNIIKRYAQWLYETVYILAEEKTTKNLKRYFDGLNKLLDAVSEGQPIPDDLVFLCAVPGDEEFVIQYFRQVDKQQVILTPKLPTMIWSFGPYYDHRLNDGSKLAVVTKQNYCYISGAEWLEYKENDGKDNKLTRYALCSNDGELGPVYGAQWLGFDGVNQIKKVIEDFKKNPFSSRLVVTAHNPGEEHLMALPPCHQSFQLFAEPDGDSYRLSLRFTMRSTDVPIGLPFNLASYGYLLLAFCMKLNCKPGMLLFQGTDVHVYSNQLNAVQTILERIKEGVPNNPVYETGHLSKETLQDMSLVDLLDVIEIKEYRHSGSLYIPVEL